MGEVGAGEKEVGIFAQEVFALANGLLALTGFGIALRYIEFDHGSPPAEAIVGQVEVLVGTKEEGECLLFAAERFGCEEEPCGVVGKCEGIVGCFGDGPASELVGPRGMERLMQAQLVDIHGGAVHGIVAGRQGRLLGFDVLEEPVDIGLGRLSVGIDEERAEAVFVREKVGCAAIDACLPKGKVFGEESPKEQAVVGKGRTGSEGGTGSQEDGEKDIYGTCSAGHDGMKACTKVQHFSDVCK